MAIEDKTQLQDCMYLRPCLHMHVIRSRGSVGHLLTKANHIPGNFPLEKQEGTVVTPLHNTFKVHYFLVLILELVR